MGHGPPRSRSVSFRHRSRQVLYSERILERILEQRQDCAHAGRKLVGPLAARSPGLQLVLALEIERHCSADEILQGRLIELVSQSRKEN